MPADSSRPVKYIGDLFDRQPPRYGMRGDSYLWQELGKQLADTPLPDSVWTLRSQLEAAWETAVGQRLSDSSTPIYLAHLDPGHGMSAGQVVPHWWSETGIILLIDRYNSTSEGSAS